VWIVLYTALIIVGGWGSPDGMLRTGIVMLIIAFVIYVIKAPLVLEQLLKLPSDNFITSAEEQTKQDYDRIRELQRDINTWNK
jgi:hypothetical protein